MITENRSGLSTADYAAILGAREDPSYQVIIERYSLDLTEHDDTAEAPVGLFDVCASSNGYIIRAVNDGDLNVDRLPSEGAGDETWEAASTPASAIDAISPSIFIDGDTIRIFFMALNTLKYVESTDAGDTWSTVTTAYDDTEITPAFIAATSMTKVHVAVYDSDQGVTRFHYLEDTGDWELVSSSIYWPGALTGFDAIAFSDKRDIIVLSGSFPPDIGARVDSVAQNNVDTVAYLRGGTACFYQQHGRWSDHFYIESFDKYTNSQRRAEIKLSKMNGYLMMTVRSIDGTSTYSHNAIQIHRSVDGINWGIADLFTVEDPDFAYGFEFVSPYVYLINNHQTYRSPSTAFSGFTHEDLIQDLTDYVTGLSTEIAEVPGSHIMLGNADGILDDTLILSRATLLLKVYYGYRVDDHFALVQTTTEFVDRVGSNKMLPDKQIEIAARSIASNMIDRKKAHQYIEREGQTLGYDQYNDQTSTGYGGLQHTAPQLGAWKTDNQHHLILQSSNTGGVAFSTFKQDIWGGSAQVGFQWASTNAKEYAGISFWAYDHSNMWVARYEVEDDRIHVYEVRGGAYIERALSAADLEWVLGTTYYLKVSLRYALITVYISTDGVHWEEHIVHQPTLIQGAVTIHNLVPIAGQSIVRGQFGLVGYGYSKQDKWNIPDWSIDDYNWDYLPLMTTLLDATPAITLSQSPATYAWTQNALGRLRNGLTNWESVFTAAAMYPSASQPRIIDFKLDPWDPKNRAFVTMHDGVNGGGILVQIDDLDSVSPTPTTILSATELDTLLGTSAFGYYFSNGAHFDLSINQEGFLGAVIISYASGPYFVYRRSRTDVWRYSQLASESNLAFGDHAPATTSGRIYCGMRQGPGFDSRILVSTDMGQSFAVDYQFTGLPVFVPSYMAMDVPYQDNNLDLILYASSQISGDPASMVRRNTDGSYTGISPFVANYCAASQILSYTYDKNQVVALTYDSGGNYIMLTMDGGSTWVQINEPTGGEPIWVGGWPNDKEVLFAIGQGVNGDLLLAENFVSGAPSSVVWSTFTYDFYSAVGIDPGQTARGLVPVWVP